MMNIYHGKLVLKSASVFALVVLCGLTFGDSLNIPTYSSVQEKDVKAFVTIGIDKIKLLQKFGPPFLSDKQADGGEVWQYYVDPRMARQTNSNYAGFEVFIKGDKVTYLGIIRRKVK